MRALLGYSGIAAILTVLNAHSIRYLDAWQYWASALGSFCGYLLMISLVGELVGWLVRRANRKHKSN